jgi:hypothetical protein
VGGGVDPGGLPHGQPVEVGVEHHGGEAPQPSGAGGVDPQTLPDGGVRAVGGEHIAGADPSLCTAFVVEECGHDALGFFGQVDELDPEPHRCVRRAEQGGFQPILRSERSDRGALGYRRVDPDHRRRGEVAVVRGVPEADTAVLRRECVRGDLVGEPELAIDLHRARVDQPRPRKRRQLAVFLDQQRGHAPAFQ